VKKKSSLFFCGLERIGCMLARRQSLRYHADIKAALMASQQDKTA